MSYKFCDREPCEGLRKALPRFLVRDWRRQNKTENLRFKMHDYFTNTDLSVYLVYCPFCGTRLIYNEDILESVAESLGMNTLSGLKKRE